MWIHRSRARSHTSESFTITTPAHCVSLRYVSRTLLISSNIYISCARRRNKKKNIKINKKNRRSIVLSARKEEKIRLPNRGDRWSTAFLLLAFLYKALARHAILYAEIFSRLSVSPFHTLSSLSFFLCALLDRPALSLPSLSPRCQYRAKSYNGLNTFRGVQISGRE